MLGGVCESLREFQKAILRQFPVHSWSSFGWGLVGGSWRGVADTGEHTVFVMT